MGDANTNGWRFFDELYDQTSDMPAQQSKIIAYIPTWRRAEGFDYGNGEMYQYITHGIIAFLTFSETNPGEFDPKSVSDIGHIIRDVVVAAHLYDTKIMVALGGANDYAFLDLMTTIGNNPAAPELDQTVRKVVDFVTTHRLDGVDLDLECWWGRPGEPDQGGRTKADGPHPAGRGLTLFARKLKQAMPDKVVSAAVFGTSWYGNNYDPEVAEHVDWLGVMTYDFTGSWDRSPVGPHSALLKIRSEDTSDIREADVYQETYLPEQHGSWPGPRTGTGGTEADNIENNPILSVEDSLWYWTNPLFVNHQGAGQKVARDKIAAGVPVYGYDFSAAKDPDDLTGEVPPGYKVLRHKDLMAEFPDAHRAENGNIKVRGSTPRPTLTEPLPPGDYPYAHNIYFETPGTAVTKLQFLRNVGAQGVIIWELSNDVWEDGKSVIKALYRASGHPEPEPVTQPPTVTGTHCLWDSVGFLGFATDDLQFKDDGIIRPGVRQFSARLWNIPDGADWKDVARRSPAVVKRQYFTRPTRIVDKGALGLWGEFDVLESVDTPAWYWGHMEPEEGGPSGHTRYRSRLWGLSLSDDWQAAAKKTPALIEGQYFDQPSEIDDQGVGGLYGLFDVSHEPRTVPAPVTEALGRNDCSYCLIGSIPSQGDNVTMVHVTAPMVVRDGTPYLYSAVTRADDSVDFPEGAVMSLQDPGGTTYDHEVEDENTFVMMSGSSIRCLVVKDPQPGNWTMHMSAPAGTGFRCECNTVPSADVYDTMVETWQKLGATQGIEPRDVTGGQVAAFLAVAAITLLVPFPLNMVTRGLILAVTGVGWLGFASQDTKDAASRSMAAAAKILSKLMKDLWEEGFSALGKYRDLVGKNISKEEVEVIRRYPRNLATWLGVHCDVYKVVEHMTDVEEQNSVRHVYWQCLLKKRLGEEFAVAMGDAHERGRPGTEADNRADELNNVIGLRLADEVDSDEDCLKRAREMWAAGELATRVDLEGDPT
ncbi:glycoside hydrolase family 18 protein [Streptomyces albus]|uniref:glycoside hydrolase family 18 protein n=1 Tax=Streptomyces albus TaxID=1888 RepID=UPI0004C74985|nr:glycoside hydrolase family 18 protein [Streptomyces albus]